MAKNLTPGTDEKTVGNYVILGTIGQGGFGIIFRVRSLSKCRD